MIQSRPEIDFESFVFKRGSHNNPEAGMYIMEAVSYISGEPFSDHPKCVCPVISRFLREWNDDIDDDNRRRELLFPFLYRVAGTKSSESIENRRSWMVFDWLVRECLPAFLDLSEPLKVHAVQLRAFDTLNKNSHDVIVPAILAAKESTWTVVTRITGAGNAAFWNAVWAAAEASLNPMVEKLQASASELVDRMIQVGVANEY